MRPSRDLGLELGEDIAALTRSSPLAAEETQRAERIVARFAPTATDVGYNLGDFCDENVVLGRDGRVHLIDVESLGIGPHDYDLARTWYRWRMAPAERRTYLAAYARHRSPSAFVASFPYWAVGSRRERRVPPAPLRRNRGRAAGAAAPADAASRALRRRAEALFGDEPQSAAGTA